MTDRRRHRGAHPKDPAAFAPKRMHKLHEAVDDLCLLATRGYGEKSALELVGNRYQLLDRQRLAVQRAGAADQTRDARQARKVAPEALRGEALEIDGYNVLLTVEAALAGGVVILARDGTLRDLTSMSTHFRSVEETRHALTLLGEFIARYECREVRWFFDQAISKSGKLRALMRELAEERAWPWTIELIPNPDPILARSGEIIATADRGILDGRSGHETPRWINLARLVVEEAVPDAWTIDLSGERARSSVRRVAVFGAAGKTGTAVIRALTRRGLKARGLIRRDEQRSAVLKIGAEGVVVGDLQDSEALDRLLVGVDAIYHLAPNVDPAEEEIARSVLAAAERAGVERIVYHSVLHPQVETMPHHWRKMRVEEMLFASSMRWTILQPAAYMQNLLVHAERLETTGALPFPYSLDAAFSLVDLEDVAQAAAVVLSEQGHESAVYELAGPQTLNARQIAEVFGQAFARDVRAEALDRDLWDENAREAGLDAPRREALLAMFRYYDDHGLVGNPGVLRNLLGRAPRDLARFAADFLKDEK